MISNPHFATAHSWAEAAPLLTFDPPAVAHGRLSPGITRIHVRDNKMRDVTIGDRTLEAHYSESPDGGLSGASR